MKPVTRVSMGACALAFAALLVGCAAASDEGSMPTVESDDVAPAAAATSTPVVPALDAGNVTPFERQWLYCRGGCGPDPVAPKRIIVAPHR